MKARRTLVLIAGICLACCAAFAVSHFLLFPLLFPLPGIGPKLTIVDDAIAGGYLSTARAELLEIRPRGESDALKVLKRAFSLSRQAGTYDLLSVIADNARASAPGSASVRLAAAYAYLRAGRLSDAEDAARRGFPSETGDMVRAEISLKRGSPWQGSDNLTRDLLALESSQKSSDFLAAARISDDRRISLDAALLLPKKGDLAGARRISSSSLQDPSFDEPAGLIAYDSGDFASALARLSRLQGRLQAGGFPRADLHLLLADSYYALGRRADAAGALQDAIRLDPKVSWTPYADLGLMAEQRGNPAAAREAFAQGRVIFPGARDLALLTARLEVSLGNTGAAISLLDDLVSRRPQDAEAALFLLGLKSPGLSAQAYRVELWRLFNRLTSDQTVFLTLAAALAASHDWEGAGIAVHQHEIAQGTQNADTLCYRGLVEAMQGRESQAAESFQEAAALDRSGRPRYDLAVLLLHQGNTQGALAQLSEAAQDAASAAGDPSAVRPDAVLAGKIYTLRGRCLEQIGDMSGARSAFLKARALDPHALDAGFELRKLEAGGHQ